MRFVAYGAKSRFLQFDINVSVVADYHHYVIDNLKTIILNFFSKIFSTA
jgi:hypothetical protein